MWGQDKTRGAEVGHMPLGQDQKTAVVAQQLKTVELMAEIPADPAIPRGTLPDCRREN